MKSLLPILAAIVLAGHPATHGQDWLPLADCVVRLQANIGNAIHGGTGAVVAVDGTTCHVLTAKHVVEAIPNWSIIWPDGTEATGQVVARGTNYDTAILRATCRPNTTYLEVAEDFAPQNATVQIYGYRGGSSQLINWQTTVLGYTPQDQNYLLTLGEGSGNGDSGAPILYCGKIVGLVSGAQLSDRGRPVNTIGPYCHPIRNLLRLVLPHGIVAGVDARRARQVTAVCPPGGT